MDRKLARTFLFAQSAIIAGVQIPPDVHQGEGAAAHLGDLDDIGGKTCAADRPDPRVRNAQRTERPAAEGGDHEQQREFENVADSSQRTDVFAPEHLYHEAAQEQQRKARERHPKHDFALETRSHSIERVEFLAEQLARREREVEDHEEQRILHPAQQPVRSAPRPQFAPQPEPPAQPSEPSDDRAHGAEVAAEELGKEHDPRGQREPHGNLEHRHRAGQRAAGQIGAEGLQPPEGAVGLDIHPFAREFRPEDGPRQGEQHAPLQQEFGKVGFSFHRLSLLVCVVCRAPRQRSLTQRTAAAP